MSRTAMFLGDSVWRESKRTLSAADAMTIARQAESELKPGFGLKLPTASYDDARAICAHITRENRRRFIFCPAVPFAVGGDS